MKLDGAWKPELLTNREKALVVVPGYDMASDEPRTY
jgi:hypothetical protein